MSTFVQTMRLEYPDHAAEIAALNKVLADLQAAQPFPPALQPTVEMILARLDHLQLASRAQLKGWNEP